VNAALHEFDWNFSELENEELICACHYEYARELKTFDQGFPHWLALVPPIPGQSTIEFREPWQRLDKERRRLFLQVWCECCPKEPGAPLLPFNRSVDFRDIGIPNVPGDYRCAEFVPELGVERLRVEIDWTWNNKQIVSAFKRWLEENRPTACPEPSERGHDPVDWRASMERLGLLRLRHHYTFSEANPFLARLRQTAKTTNSGECNREAKKAVDDFRRIFRFLPRDEMPLSWPMK
jgi:hypothetical protein